ncbi:type IIL restriction-modification enzyme MmeI [Corynebacterium tuberculostearicum]|uniref:type IIL restriction-modification enzyme MmeI n=1 Tax=Corynebacterium tuberculostearicum TaxID=38304 RepID=UPI002934B45C|nr:type IIL restriction-modification enzyme MmeI [Corynebacterium tuberculostearicum]
MGHYNPLAMDPALVKAHDALDREVDKAFGASRKLTTVRQRQELLFANYEKLTTQQP